MTSSPNSFLPTAFRVVAALGQLFGFAAAYWDSTQTRAPLVAQFMHATLAWLLVSVFATAAVMLLVFIVSFIIYGWQDDD